MPPYFPWSALLSILVLGYLNDLFETLLGFISFYLFKYLFEIESFDEYYWLRKSPILNSEDGILKLTDFFLTPPKLLLLSPRDGKIKN